MAIARAVPLLAAFVGAAIAQQYPCSQSSAYQRVIIQSQVPLTFSPVLTQFLENGKRIPKWYVVVISELTRVPVV